MSRYRHASIGPAGVVRIGIHVVGIDECLPSPAQEVAEDGEQGVGVGKTSVVDADQVAGAPVDSCFGVGLIRVVCVVALARVLQGHFRAGVGLGDVAGIGADQNIQLRRIGALVVVEGGLRGPCHTKVGRQVLAQLALQVYHTSSS